MSQRLLLTFCAAALLAVFAGLLVKGLWTGRDQPKPPSIIAASVLDPEDDAYQQSLQNYHKAYVSLQLLEEQHEKSREKAVRDFTRKLGELRESGLLEEDQEKSLNPAEISSISQLKEKITRAREMLGENSTKRQRQEEQTIKDTVIEWNEVIAKVDELKNKLEKAQTVLNETRAWLIGTDRKRYGIEWIWITDSTKTNKESNQGFWISKSEIRVGQADADNLPLPPSHADHDSLRRRLLSEPVRFPQPSEARLRQQAVDSFPRLRNYNRTWNDVMTNPGFARDRDPVRNKFNQLMTSETARLRREAEANRLKPLDGYPEDRSSVTATDPREAVKFADQANVEFGGGGEWRFRLPTAAEWRLCQAAKDKLEGIGEPDFSEWVTIREPATSASDFKPVDPNWQGASTNPPPPGTTSFRLVFAAE